MRWESAWPAFNLTVLLVSFKALRKVVCSWGRKGLSMALALANRMARVSNTAVFTL